MENTEVVNKIRKWCAYQERSHFETAFKLTQLGVDKNVAGHIISELVQDNYLNEGRYASAFARGKFKIKHWGKIKIKAELSSKRISTSCINQALQEIRDTEYLEVLEKIILKKLPTIKETDPLRKKYKLMNTALLKGFEKDLVNDVLKKLKL